MEAKHTADSILKAARGFMVSRVLLSGAELDIFNLVAEEPLTAGQIASVKKADLRAVTILLDALSALPDVVAALVYSGVQNGLLPCVSR